MGFLFLFVDGVGIGKPGDQNPFSRATLGILGALGASGDEEGSSASIPFGGEMVPLDAALGVSGLPQSATGQTSLLTGVNAQGLLGRHLQGFPNKRLRQVIAEHGLLRRAASLGRTAFANAYTPRFFDPSQKVRESVTTVSMRTAGIPLKTLEDLRAGEALFHDFTNRVLIENGFEAPILEPGEAAKRLGRIAESHDFLLYEHFLTDVAGHEAAIEKGMECATTLDRFLWVLLEKMDLNRHSVFLSSDHGNLEDCSTRSHTRNPVPALVWGKAASTLPGRLRAITDVTPAILEFLAQ